IQRRNYVLHRAVCLTSDDRRILLGSREVFALIPVASDHVLIKFRHGAVPPGDRAAGDGCRFLRVRRIRVNTDALRSRIIGYAKIDLLADIAQLHIVVAADLVGRHVDLYAVYSDFLIRHLSRSTAYSLVLDARRAGGSALRADLYG